MDRESNDRRRYDPVQRKFHKLVLHKRQTLRKRFIDGLVENVEVRPAGAFKFQNH